ncbi:MAG: hypothetical protein ACKOXA_12670 [Polynucleobacter sp.]
MAPWKAARVGDHINEVDTPALILDLDAFERNMKLNKMRSLALVCDCALMPRVISALRLPCVKLS